MGILKSIKNYIPDAILYTGFLLLGFADYKLNHYKPSNSDIPFGKYTLNQCFTDNPNMDDYAKLEMILVSVSAPILIVGGALAIRAKINGETMSSLNQFSRDMREVQNNMEDVRRNLG